MKHRFTLLRRGLSTLGLLAAFGSSAQAQCPPPIIGPTRDVGNVTVGTSVFFTALVQTCPTGMACAGLTATVVGPNAGEFGITSNTCDMPTFTGTCAVNMGFSPAACGPRVAFLVLVANGPSTQGSVTFPAGCPVFIIPLTGTGIATPVVGPPLTFPSACAGTLGASVTLTLPANTSASIVGPGNFSITGTTCPVGTGTCTVTVRFNPLAAACGAVTSTLIVTSTLTGCPLATFALSGFACSFTCAIGLAGTANLTAAGRKCILDSLQIAAASTGLTRCAALRCAECCAETDLARLTGDPRGQVLALLDQIRCLEACFGCAPFPC